MTNFSLDEHSVLPSTISPSQNWQVAAPYFSRSKKRWLQKKADLVGAAPLLYPATIVEVTKDRTSALIRYHDEPGTTTRRIPAEHILYPATSAPRNQRCNRWDELLWQRPEPETEEGLCTPPPPEPKEDPPPPNADPVPRRFEMQGANGPKFWQISRGGRHTTTQYGSVGAEPRASHRDHNSPDKAIRFFEDLIESKLKKGYCEVLDPAAPTVFVAKWAQKCSCGCKYSVSPGDEIVRFPNRDLGSRRNWAIRAHIEEPWNYQ